MAAETESEQWQQAPTNGKTMNRVFNTFVFHKQRSFTPSEVVETMLDTFDDSRDVLPKSLLRAYDEGNEEPLVSYVSGVITHLEWWGILESRIVAGEKYYALTTDGTHPVSVLDTHNDVIRELEKRIEELESRLEDVE